MVKIQSLEMKNFRNFKGAHQIDSSMSGGKGKNVLLVGGANGSGKTSIFKAIKTCLFGKRINGEVYSKNEYDNLLYSLSNKEIRDDNSECYVQLTLKLDDQYPSSEFKVERRWSLKNGEIENKELLIKEEKDGEPLKFVPQEYWEDYLTSLFPSDISNFFLFGGEEMRVPISGSEAETILSNSIESALGLSLHNQLIDDLDNLERKIKKKNIDLEEKNERLEELESKLSQKKKKFENLGERSSKVRSKISELENKKQQKEEKLRREANSYAKKREKIKSKISGLKKEKERLDNEIENICENYLPFVIPQKVFENLENQLEKEKKVKKKKAQISFIENIKSDLPEYLIEHRNRDSNYSKEDLKTFNNWIEDYFNQLLAEKKGNEIGLVHKLSESKINNLKAKLREAKKKTDGEFIDYLEKADDISIEIKKLRSKLKDVPEDVFIEDSIDTISKIKSEIDRLREEKQSIVDRRDQLKEDIESLEEKIRSLEDRIYSGKKAEKKVDLTSKARKAEIEFIDKVVSSRIENLEDSMSKRYRMLTNKEDMVEKIRIDKNDLSVRLIDASGNVVDRENISTGEKEIFSVSLLWTLADISNYELPVVMDAPLASLGGSHAENIVKHFFPNVGDQVIVLSTKRDINREIYNKLEPSVYQSYTISLETSNKIHAGYNLGEDV